MENGFDRQTLYGVYNVADKRYGLSPDAVILKFQFARQKSNNRWFKKLSNTQLSFSIF